MKEKMVDCPICGGSNFMPVWDKILREQEGKLRSAVIRDEEGNIVNGRNVVCKKCGLVFLNPRLDDESLKAFYDGPYREIYGTNVANNLKSEQTHANNAVSVMNRMTIDPHEKRFLDIGCSSGQLVKIIAQYTKAEGVEASSKFSEMGLEGGGVIYNKDFEDFIAVVDYDVITMLNTLEHLTDPCKTLLKIRSIMKDDGILLVSVPNIFNTMLTRNMDAFMSNAHLYNFSHNTLTMLMMKCGLNPIYMETILEEIGEKIYMACTKDTIKNLKFDEFDSHYEDIATLIYTVGKLGDLKIKLLNQR